MKAIAGRPSVNRGMGRVVARCEGARRSRRWVGRSSSSLHGFERFARHLVGLDVPAERLELRRDRVGIDRLREHADRGLPVRQLGGEAFLLHPGDAEALVMEAGRRPHRRSRPTRSAGGAMTASTRPMPTPFPVAPSSELVLLDLAVVVEDEDADRVELDIRDVLVPGVERPRPRRPPPPRRRRSRKRSAAGPPLPTPPWDRGRGRTTAATGRRDPSASTVPRRSGDVQLRLGRRLALRHPLTEVHELFTIEGLASLR